MQRGEQTNMQFHYSGADSVPGKLSPVGRRRICFYLSLGSFSEETVAELRARKVGIAQGQEPLLKCSPSMGSSQIAGQQHQNTQDLTPGTSGFADFHHPVLSTM